MPPAEKKVLGKKKKTATSTESASNRASAEPKDDSQDGDATMVDSQEQDSQATEIVEETQEVSEFVCPDIV